MNIIRSKFFVYLINNIIVLKYIKLTDLSFMEDELIIISQRSVK